MFNQAQHDLKALVAASQQGDRNALEALVRSVQKNVYNLAVRFLWHPQDAEDAAQEILIRVITGLSGFEGKSSFRTWVYRIAYNTLLTQGKKRMEQAALSFEQFGDALAEGFSEPFMACDNDFTKDLLLEEVKIGCTHAMLLCLDREHRFAYILGEILDLDHNEGAKVLAITHAAFRKRLSRAKQHITSFMTTNCGLIDPNNACRCKLRINCAVERGYANINALNFAPSLAHARKFPEVLLTIQQLEDSRRAAALYRSHPQWLPSADFISWLNHLLDEFPDINQADFENKKISV